MDHLGQSVSEMTRTVKEGPPLLSGQCPGVGTEDPDGRQDVDRGLPPCYPLGSDKIVPRVCI